MNSKISSPKNSKVALFQFAGSSVHLAAGLEIIAGDNRKDKKYFYFWGSQTHYPNRMAEKLETIGYRIPRRIKKIMNKLEIINDDNKMPRNSKKIKSKLHELETKLNGLETIEELREFEVEEHNIGKFLVNELTFLTKDPEFQLIGKKEIVRKLVRSYLEVYFAAIAKIADKQIDTVLVYNGRFLHERAIIEAARKSKINFIIYETMRNRILIRNDGFHSRISNQKHMIQHWENSDTSLESKIEIGSRYFSDLRSSSNPFLTSSVSRSEYNGYKYFAFFSSSDDEVAGLWDTQSESLGKQIDCVRKLQEIFDNQNEYKLIIRIHPNLKNKSESQIRAWAELKNSKNTVVISHLHNISSYQILDNSIGVITFGSTVGLEAAHMRIPTLVLTDCGHDLLGVVDKAKSWHEVIEWISQIKKIDTKLLDTRRINSCIRGFYLETAGIQFKFSTLVQRGWGQWDVTYMCGYKYKDNFLQDFYHLILSRIKMRNLGKI